MSKRCVIISGGELDEELTLSVLKQQKDRCVIEIGRASCRERVLTSV